MKNEGIDALYISNVPNVAYFTGKKGDDCKLYIRQSEAYIITDFRYKEMAESLGWLKFAELRKGYSLVDIIKSFNDSTIGIEKEHLSLNDYQKLCVDLVEKSLKPVAGLVESLREVKDDYEIECTKNACDIANKAFLYMLDFIKPGMRECDCAAWLEYYLKSHGADGISFNTILISGTKTSMPHGVPNTDIIHNNSFVTLDFGCTYRGYCSDMTRTFGIGSVSDEMKQVYEIVLKAQNECCNAIKAGMLGSEIDAIARNIIESEGYGEYFGHGTGHGTGLEIHENPRYSPSYDKPILENSIVSIEPGIYLPGKFGVRIEDLALVTKNGILNFVTAPKELLII